VLGDGAVLAAALDRLRKARKPLIVAGLGAVLHRAGASIRRLSEAAGAPVLTTYKAKGILPEDHPNALGGHGLSPKSDAIVLPLLEQSDGIICLGYDPIEMRAAWIRPWAPEKALEFCHAQAEHGMHGSALRWVGDVDSAARALAHGLDGKRHDTWTGGEIEAARAALAEAFAPRPSWGPHAIFAALGELPGDAVVTVDSGAHRILLSQMFRARRPGHLLQSAAFCTMAVALPLAIGYKRAAPDVPVVAVLGDGGLDMAPGDLATLRDLRLPLTVVVLVDGALALIARKQQAMQLPERGVTLGRTDLVRLAEAYGGHGETVASVEALKQALHSARERETFTLLACHVDKGDYLGTF